MNSLAKNVATGTAVGVASAYALAPDLTTLTMHYVQFSDAALPFQVVDAWTRTINAFWSVVVTAVGSVVAVYLPAAPSLPASIQTAPDTPQANVPPHNQQGENPIGGNP